MLKILAICHALVTLILLALVTFLLLRHGAPHDSLNLVRARRLEIIDRSGKLRAVVDGDGGAGPELKLLDNDGRQALFMTVNRLGYATVYFQSKRTEGKVSVGYLWGSDSLPSNTEDPLARWGIRVRDMNGRVRDLSAPDSTPDMAR